MNLDYFLVTNCSIYLSSATIMMKVVKAFMIPFVAFTSVSHKFRLKLFSAQLCCLYSTFFSLI